MAIAPSLTPAHGLPAQSLEERLRELDIRSPVDPEAASRWRAAPRLSSLDGTVGGFLGNKKANAEVLLEEVRALMVQRFALREGVAVDKFIYSRPAADDIIESLAARCDFVVTAIAD